MVSNIDMYSMSNKSIIASNTGLGSVNLATEEDSGSTQENPVVKEIRNE